MIPAVNLVEVLQAVDERNFRRKAFMNLPRHRRSQGGRGKTAPRPIEMPPMIKKIIITTKRCFQPVQFL